MIGSVNHVLNGIQSFVAHRKKAKHPPSSLPAEDTSEKRDSFKFVPAKPTHDLRLGFV